MSPLSTLAALFAEADNAVIVLDNGRSTTDDGPAIAFANPAMARLTGRTIAELTGRGCLALLDTINDPAVIERLAAALDSDTHLRADVFQEVSLTLWQLIDSYDPSRSFGAWARGIAAKKILQLRERSARFPIAFSPDTIQAVVAAYDRTESEAAAGSDRTEALRQCVGSLPDRSRQLLVLRYEEDLSGEQIAQRLGGSVDAIYQTLSRLRARLEECIRRRLALLE